MPIEIRSFSWALDEGGGVLDVACRILKMTRLHVARKIIKENALSHVARFPCRLSIKEIVASFVHALIYYNNP